MAPAVLALAAFAVVGCASAGPPSATTSPRPSISSADPGLLAARLASLDDAVDRWRSASDLRAAHRAAEEARNLTVGPSGPSYGDANRDGTIEGASTVGLLPGLDGEPGLATATAGRCVESDVLGGGWADPAARWSTLRSAIAAWTPSNNTFPALPSHPQRIVGWATLTLAATELATAVEYGGHASLHVRVSTRAVADCAE